MANAIVAVSWDPAIVMVFAVAGVPTAAVVLTAVGVLAVVNIQSVYSVSTSWSLSLDVPFVSDAAVGPSVAVL